MTCVWKFLQVQNHVMTWVCMVLSVIKNCKIFLIRACPVFFIKKRQISIFLEICRFYAGLIPATGTNRVMPVRLCDRFVSAPRQMHASKSLRLTRSGIQIYQFIVNFFGCLVSIFCFGTIIVRMPSLYSAVASSAFIGWSKDIVLWYLPQRNSEVW